MNCASSEQLLSKPFLANDIDRELAERNLRDFETERYFCRVIKRARAARFGPFLNSD
jgi:hypothetical protein